MKRLKYMLILQTISTLLSATVNGQMKYDTTKTALVERFFFVVHSQQAMTVTVADSSNQQAERPPENNSDSAYINYLKANFIVADTNFAKGERTKEGHYTHMMSELLALRQFLQGYPSGQLIIRPAGIGKEGVFAALTPYQQANTLVVLSTKDPKKVLLYVLVLPAGIAHGREPRILSWQLVYAYGCYEFEDMLGNKGWEALLEGVKGR